MENQPLFTGNPGNPSSCSATASPRMTRYRSARSTTALAWATNVWVANGNAEAASGTLTSTRLVESSNFWPLSKKLKTATEYLAALVTLFLLLGLRWINRLRWRFWRGRLCGKGMLWSSGSWRKGLIWAFPIWKCPKHFCELFVFHSEKHFSEVFQFIESTRVWVMGFIVAATHNIIDELVVT